MYTYILMLVLGNYNLGIATTQIEFKNYESCVTAGKTIKHLKDYRDHICIKKEK